MMKSRTSSKTSCICRLYSSRSTGAKRRSGNSASSLAMPLWIEVDAGRFERLDEAARKAQRDDVARSTPARRRPAVKRRCRGSASGSPSRLASSNCSASSSAEMRARIDVAVAHAVLQRNSPLPAGVARGRAGEGVGLARKRGSERRLRGRTAASGSSPRSRCRASPRSAGRESPSSR